MRDNRGRPVLEYLEDGTPMVWCVDFEGERVLRRADEVLPPPLQRPPGTPACDPRRTLWHVLLLVLFVFSLVAASNDLQLRRLEHVSAFHAIPSQRHPIANYGWIVIGPATLIYMLYRRRRIALWDTYVQQGGDAAREDPAAVERATRASTFVMVGVYGWWYLLMPNRRNRPQPNNPSDRAG